MNKPPYTARNVVGLIGELMVAKHAYNTLCNDPHSFFDSRQEACEDLIKAENQLVEALEEVLKK
jgi:hypothetical protein